MDYKSKDDLFSDRLEKVRQEIISLGRESPKYVYDMVTKAFPHFLPQAKKELDRPGAGPGAEPDPRQLQQQSPKSRS